LEIESTGEYQQSALGENFHAKPNPYRIAACLLPPSVSMENVKFYRARKTAIERRSAGKSNKREDAEDDRDSGA
jgi:hypothetical protein